MHPAADILPTRRLRFFFSEFFPSSVLCFFFDFSSPRHSRVTARSHIEGGTFDFAAFWCPKLSPFPFPFLSAFLCAPRSFLL